MNKPFIDENPKAAGANKLLRILGVGFGLAIVIGGTIGVGILRNPGGVAAQLPSVGLILLAWTLGGIYCLLGANYLSELATMTPKAGGYYVYAHRAYGDFGGFVVGWSDWLYQTLGLAYITVVFGEYASGLFAPKLTGGRVIFSVAILIVIAILNYIGLRTGSGTQKLTSLLKCLALIAFVVACFVFGGSIGMAPVESSPSAISLTTFAGLVAFILAFQLVLGTFDGWHEAIYFTEEDKNPGRNIPRSLFGGLAIIITIYLLVNIALIYVLPMSELAGSKFAGADAIAMMFGERSGQIVTVLALISLIGIINAILMACPRILLALSRDGLFFGQAAKVNEGGTPVFGLVVTASTAIILASIGTFELLLAISAFFGVVIASLLVVALFILRRSEPDAERPFRAFGYPFAPAAVLVISVLLAVGYVVSNTEPSIYALIALALTYPVFRLTKRSSKVAV